MAQLPRSSLQLEITEYKLHKAKVLMDRYQADFQRCQVYLTKESKKRKDLEQYCEQLHKLIGLLETELIGHQTKDREMQEMFGEADRIHNDMRHTNQMQSERIELLTCELTRMHNLAMEADRTAQLSQQRAKQMSQKLQRSELQLEQSHTKQITLQSELAAAAQNLRCVECAVEHASQKLQLVDNEMLLVKQRLEESERRAHLAELAAQRKQLSSAQLEQRIEKQLEERWRQLLNNLELHFIEREQ